MRNPYENLPEGVEGRAFAEFRATDDEGTEIEGHAATFDEPYDVGPFVEKIAPGAFDDVLEDDVRALVNHNPDKLLGRTSSGTLEVGTDDTGLTARVNLPDTSDGRDVRELVKRGDLDQMSFGFEVAEDSWEDLEDGTEMRTIERVKKLWDVSPVTFPANPATDVALRSRDEWREKRGAEDADETVVEGGLGDDELGEMIDRHVDALRRENEEVRRVTEAMERRQEEILAELGLTREEIARKVSERRSDDETDEADEPDVGELADRIREARLEAALKDTGIE